MVIERAFRGWQSIQDRNPTADFAPTTSAISLQKLGEENCFNQLRARTAECTFSNFYTLVAENSKLKNNNEGFKKS